MSDIPTPGGGSDPLADSPLFREIQRVLMSTSGPVNWELARQIGIAVAAWDRDDPEPSDEDRRMLAEGVRMAELAVSEATGLDAPASVARVEAVRRAGWVEANVAGLRSLFEPQAAKLASVMAEARRQDMPAEAMAMAPMMESMLGQLGPLLMGAQVGTVIGQLGRGALGTYELPFPRSDPSALLFVVPNIAAFEREWSLEPLELRTWVALHETAHAFCLDRPWVRDHLEGIVRELAEQMSFDVAGLESRLAGIDPSDPQALQEAFGDPSELLGGEVTEEHRLLERRLKAFVAAAEGYAHHVMSLVGPGRLGSFARIEEAMRRRHEGRSQEERMVERMVGLELEDEQYALGREFCDRVAREAGEPTLGRMWSDAGSLPSMPELEEPTLWLSRMA